MKALVQRELACLDKCVLCLCPYHYKLTTMTRLALGELDSKY